MNKAQELFLTDFSLSPISKDHTVIDYSEFWDKILDPRHNINLAQNACENKIHRASYYHDGYVYFYYSVKSHSEQLVDEDVFACKYIDDDLPLPSDHWDGGMYEEF